MLPFTEIKAEISANINAAVALNFIMIIACSLFVVLLASAVAVSIVNPVITLLNIVQHINAKDIKDDMPHMDGGSKEVTSVYGSFEKLYKVVRFSNAAFFSGDLFKAFCVLEEANKLFVELNNPKAMAVASNNLANTYSMIYKKMNEAGQFRDKWSDEVKSFHGAGITAPEAKKRGLQAFDCAIGSAEQDLAKAQEGERAGYETQIANRLFNKGLFKWRVGDKEEAEFDFRRAREFDKEVAKKGSGDNFSILLSRVRSMMTLVKQGGTDCIGGEVLLAEAKSELDKAREKGGDGGGLFKDITFAGRLQEWEGLSCDWLMAIGEVEQAAKVGVRMLVEDMYVATKAAAVCSRAVLAWSADKGLDKFARKMKKDIKAGGVAIEGLKKSKRLMFCLDYSGSMNSVDDKHGETRMIKANRNMLMIYDKYCDEEDEVGFIRFNHEVDDRTKGLGFHLEVKGGQEAGKNTQRRVLVEAIDARGGTNFYSALSVCVADLEKNGEGESNWIVALTDGDSRDTPVAVKARIAELGKQGCDINLVIVGVEVSQAVVSLGENLCSVNESSIFVDARGGMDSMDDAFKKVADVISGGDEVVMEEF